jgi:NIPSNAP
MNCLILNLDLLNCPSAKRLRLYLTLIGLVLVVMPDAFGENPAPTLAANAVTPTPTSDSSMIYHCIRYTIDPRKVDDFEIYARRWMEGGIIKRCGGEPLGYFLPKRGYGGPDNIAFALIGFKTLAAYEEYRAKLLADPEAKENLEFAKRSGCILTEDRSYFYRVGNEH